MITPTDDFPRFLKSWRANRGVSQLELSLRCEVSQKHISFLELARSAPSRAMVMRICDSLDIPLRDQNALLVAAGFAPGYRESALTQPELSAVDQALTMMLAQQEPYPAVVLDRLYNVVRANRGAARLQALLFEVERPEDLPAIAGNILRGLFYPQGYRRYIKNWDDIAPCLLRQLRREIYAGGGSPELRGLLQELEQCEGVPDDWKQHLPGDWLAPVLTVDIEKDGLQLSFFSTIATLGTPLDVTLQETRIEAYFPADDATRKFFAQA